MTDPAPVPATVEAARPLAIPGPIRVGPGDLFAALIADARTPATERARSRDVADLGRFLGAAGPAAACAALVAGDAGTANALALAYRRHLQDRGLAAATVNRRLATVRKVAELARRLGLVGWAIDVEGLKVIGYRDTAGPGLDGWRRLERVAADAGDGPKARRDRAMLRLLHDNALRRGELVAIDVGDLDLDGRRVAVRGKGRSAKEWLDLNPAAVAALAAWVEARGDHPGPLFLSFDRTPRGGGRLTADGLHAIVAALSRRAGLARPARPHGIRHQAITRALDLTGGNVRMVQQFARHADPKTTQRYDDAREGLAGVVTRLLGEDRPGGDCSR